MENLLVSIIIPAFNSSQLVKGTLNSVLTQTYENWECIIVDDDSTDNTIKIIEDYVNKDSRFSIYKRPNTKPKGANACRNYGFKLSKGEYILFLDSDDVLKNTCLENRLKVFKTEKKLDFVIANTSYLKDGIFYSKPICEFSTNYTSEEYLKLFLSYKLPWTVMSVLWKKSTIQNFKFDENLSRLQDLDFHISILSKKTYQIKRLNEVDTYYRVEDKKVSNSNHIITVIDSLNYFLNKHINQDYIQKKYPSNFKNFIISFLINYLYPNYSKYKLKIIEIEKIIHVSKIFNIKELFLLKVEKLLLINGLINKKGFGMNRINKFIKNKLRYE